MDIRSTSVLDTQSALAEKRRSMYQGAATKCLESGLQSPNFNFLAILPGVTRSFCRSSISVINDLNLNYNPFSYNNYIKITCWAVKLGQI
jgi:hypothetical protein